MLRFTPHGEYRILSEDNMLFVEAKGPFNLEVVNNYSTDMAKAVKKMVAPWTQLVILHQDGLFTPEAEREMYNTIKLRKELGLSASAIVIIGATARFAMEMQISGLYQQLQVVHQYFDTEKDARDWLLKTVPVRRK